MSFSRARKKREPLGEAALYEYAVGALSRQMRTVAQLKRLMRSRVEEGEAGEAKVNAVVVRLKEQRYLNDTAFAEEYTRLRQTNERFGKRRVQQGLIQKGVHSDLIARTLETAYENVDEEALARAHLARKRVRKPESEKETARVMRLLLRGGFSTGVIFKILKNWQVDDETLAALDSFDPENDSGD